MDMGQNILARLLSELHNLAHYTDTEPYTKKKKYLEKRKEQ